MIKALKNIIKYFVGFFCYVTLKCANYFIKDTRMLKCLKYKIYHWISQYSIKKYKSIKKNTEEKVVACIHAKKQIRVAFIVYTSSMWFFDELYKLLEDNSRFEPSIIIGHFKMTDFSSSELEYNNCYDFFSRKEYRIGTINTIDDQDVLFFLTPFDFYEKQLLLNNLYLSHLVFHASYSYMLVGNSSKLFLDMYHLSYRYYTDSQYYKTQLKNIVEKYSNNARYIGYPKMDQFYLAKCSKISDKKVIIYAPHHSVNYTEFKSATFEDNYRFFMELIKRTKNDVYWIYKPHPLLRDHCVVANIFESYDEYDAFLDELKQSGNVAIVDNGDYFEYFKSSDAMITDSVSFLAEYQFTGKPLLLLMSGKEKYNEFGNSVVNILYKCAGDDFSSIESFVSDVINDIDPMKSEREKFFKANLDYKYEQNNSANYRIYKDFLDVFSVDAKNKY